MEEVRYICKRTVVSTKAVEAGKYFPLSVLDRQMENNRIRMVYYYPTSPPEADKIGEMTKKLRNSLAETLTFFPIITGRLIKDDDKGHWKVNCNDAGVRMVEGKAKGSVHRWLKHVNREKELQLLYCEPMFRKPYFWSTFYVQITEFEEGGIAIGLSFSHLLADTTCATKFMHAWADILSMNKMSAPPLFHPLPSRRLGNKNPNHQPYLNLINHYKSSTSKPIISATEAKYTTISFGFSNEMVRTCMSMVQSPGGPTPSPFEALAGLFWVCLSMIRGMNKNNGLVDMSICLDVRKALGLDYGFFGNCMVYNKVHARDSENNNNNRLAQAASSIREVVSKMNGSEGIMDLIEWLEDNDDGLINCPTMTNCHDLICADIGEVNPYLTRFEGEFEPIRVSYYVEPVLEEGQVLIMPASSKEGPLSRVVMVTLRDQDEAIKLREDELISHLGPATSMKID
ncbi:hypothetical protein K1719_044043 [Acacia pycnantha]|nr:hypothetical protein K1719_044043 [Acacia pycnantha]